MKKQVFRGIAFTVLGVVGFMYGAGMSMIEDLFFNKEESK